MLEYGEELIVELAGLLCPLLL